MARQTGTMCLLALLAIGALVAGCRTAQAPAPTSTKQLTPSSRQGAVSERTAEQARKAAVHMLIALKEQNVSRVDSLLCSKNASYYLVKKRGKANVAANAATYGLASMHKSDIKTAVKAIPNANPGLLADIVKFGLNADWADRWSPNGLPLVAVEIQLPKCSIQTGHTGETLLAVMVKEDGKWKMSDFPAFRLGILRYQRVLDAIDAHDQRAVPGL